MKLGISILVTLMMASKVVAQSLTGMRGVDHIGMTVPNLHEIDSGTVLWSSRDPSK